MNKQITSSTYEAAPPVDRQDFGMVAMNVNHGLANMLMLLKQQGVQEDSRNGPVIALPATVIVRHAFPQKCVIQSPLRNANPFFHHMEALWMLAGRNDLLFLTHYVKKMAEFSDDGETLWGAYGYRWRYFFGHDQLPTIADELRINPNTRRCVLSMWNAWDHDGEGISDMYKATSGGRDVPCNTQAYFKVRDGHLDMTVTNRSNDVLWGMFGANMVHFSYLLQYMAMQTDLPIGSYRQFSDNAHLYTKVLAEEDIDQMINDLMLHDAYLDPKREQWQHVPFLATGETKRDWDEDLASMLSGEPDYQRLETKFFRGVSYPIWSAWEARKHGDKLTAMQNAKMITDPYWRIACLNWLQQNMGAH